MPATRPARHRAPLQERSRKTLDRVLAATEELLRTKTFEEISVAEIVRRARASVGAFYVRFADKDALLPLIYRRYDEDLRTRFDELLKPEKWRGLDLHARVDELARIMVRLFRERRGLLRAVALYARLRPASIPAEVRAARARTMDAFAALILEPRDEIGHPEPEDAARFAIFMAAAICRDKILFGEAPHASTVPIDDDRLARELARMLHGYLAGPAAPRSRAARSS